MAFGLLDVGLNDRGALSALGNRIPQDYRPLVYCYAIRYGKSQDWHWLWQRYLKSNVASARVNILNALGCSRDGWVLRRWVPRLRAISTRSARRVGKDGKCTRRVVRAGPPSPLLGTPPVPWSLSKRGTLWHYLLVLTGFIL